MAESIHDATDDLMVKIGADVMATMMRTIDLSDNHLPVAVAGGSAAIGIISAILNNDRDIKEPDADSIMLAALIVARIGAKHPDAIGQAYKDLELLKGQGHG